MQKRTAHLTSFFQDSFSASKTKSSLDQFERKLTFLEKMLHIQRVVIRVFLIGLWSCLCIVLQSLFLKLPGSAKIRMPRLFWKKVCTMLGLKVRVIGAPIRNYKAKGRPVIYISNHSSWLDVPVLGASVYACFVAKEEVGTWPIISTISRLGRTIYVSRQRGTTGRERDTMITRLQEGDNLILFPEGTSSDGSRVLPFLSSFFSIAKTFSKEEKLQRITPLLQPVSIVYDQLENLPVGRRRRSIFAWYGDMELAPHFWKLGQWRNMRTTVLLHPPIDPDLFSSRKALAITAWKAVDEGAAALRQMREPPVL
ncbi:lysophospholipid acyltransferase family protein [Entomobacter blattae]|uniref:Acyltransferase n=1 Tax=Entomobacter blattae TaxID=2762277 RepID=A0A7H1NTF8_9PROT|nr:lysophospholipid acyltransferase family protein [Entomobacter blattae]QNT79068.1 Acyltransferase [Entomobacter blattae]